MEDSRRIDVCNTNVHQASDVKQLRSKNYLESMRQDEKIIPDWLFEEEQDLMKTKKGIYMVLNF